MKTNEYIKKVLPMGLLLMTLHTSCQNEEMTPEKPQEAKLEIVTRIRNAVTRNVITGNTLPNGSSIGVMVVDATGTSYQDQVYNNVCYTAQAGSEGQEWVAQDGISLSGETAKLYAYHPWKPDTDIESIPVDLSTAQDDWMYATPVEGLNNTNHTAQIELKHALSNMRITLVKGNYVGTGKVSKVALVSEGMAVKAMLNAKTGALTGVQQQGESIVSNMNEQIGDEPLTIDLLFVPTTETDTPVKVDVTVDNTVYTVTSEPVTTQPGTQLNFSLIQNSTMLALGQVSVTPWTEIPKQEDMELEKVK